MAKGNRIEVVLSDPCIELWFVLHFRDQWTHIERSQAKSDAKEFLKCGKSLTSEALNKLQERFDQARTRARGLDIWHEENESPPRPNPSSDMWRLIDRINEK